MTRHDRGAFRDVANEGFYLRVVARKMLDDRLNREKYLPVSLFGESAWDALLMLFADEPGHSQSVESFAHKLNVLPLTMGRWVSVLENEGLIETRAQSLILERAIVKLSESGRAAVREYLRATAD